MHAMHAMAAMYAKVIFRSRHFFVSLRETGGWVVVVLFETEEIHDRAHISHISRNGMLMKTQLENVTVIDADKY